MSLPLANIRTIDSLDREIACHSAVSENEHHASYLIFNTSVTTASVGGFKRLALGPTIAGFIPASDFDSREVVGILLSE